jgi:hypothetical protein
MVPREFDVSRDSVSQLRRLTMPINDSRRATNSNAKNDDGIEAEMRQMVINALSDYLIKNFKGNCGHEGIQQ